MRLIDGTGVQLYNSIHDLICKKQISQLMIRCLAIVIFVLSSTLLLSPFVPVASAHSQTRQFTQQEHTTHHILHMLAGNGRITGQLQDGSNKNASLAGQKVTLQAAQGTNSSDLATATTDSHGLYSFNNLSTDKTLSYAVYMLYQGGQYTSNVVTLDSKPSQTVNLTVYESTSSLADLVVLQATLLVRPPDAQHSLLTVSEIFFFRNIGSKAFVGSFDTGNGSHLPNALRFSLPGSAKAVTLGTGFSGYQTAQVDLGFATNAAIPPGESQFSFSFQIPYTLATYDFAYTVVYPTLQLSVLVPTDLHVDSGFLASGGIITTDQHPYQTFQGTQLRTDDQVHVQLQGLPLPTKTSSPTPFNPVTIWLIAAVLVLLALAIAAWYLWSTQRTRSQRRNVRGVRGVSGRAKAKNVSGTKENAVKASSKSLHGSDDSRDKKREALLQELLTLDKSFEAGKISKAAYQERRAKAKARLRAIMRESKDSQNAQGQEASRR